MLTGYVNLSLKYSDPQEIFISSEELKKMMRFAKESDRTTNLDTDAM
jgi:hypothetical protein